jgi:hypothetical protein
MRSPSVYFLALALASCLTGAIPAFAQEPDPNSHPNPDGVRWASPRQIDGRPSPRVRRYQPCRHNWFCLRAPL